jgi:hypothetical protein
VNDQLDTAPQQLDPFTAGVQLQVVVDQLTQPTVVHLDRDLTPGTDAWQQQRDDQALVDDAWQRLAAAVQDRDRSAFGQACATLDLTHRRIAARETPTVTLPPLIHQLQDAVAGSGNTDHGTPSTGATRSPVALGAVDLLAEIGQTIGAPTGTPVLRDRLRVWAWRVLNDETQVVRAAELAADWPDRARNLLDPPKKWTTPGACPQCGKDTAYTQQDGEQHRRPAIEFDRANARARCLCCPARWEGEQQLRQLNKALTEEETS